MSNLPARLVLPAMLIAAALALTGCPPRPGAGTRPPPNMPTYNQVVEQYNANARQLNTLWARVVTEVHWRRDGHAHFEQGDGILMVIQPDRASLSIGKAGNTLLWAGSNATRYWLLDLRNDADRMAYVGTRGAPADTRGAGLPVPIYPPDLLEVLGIAPLPTAVVQPPVRWVEGGFQVQPPGTSIRLLIDPRTYLARRIDLVDETGQPRLVATLSKPQPVVLTGHPPGGLPQVATAINLTIPGRDGNMSLFLTALSDGKDKINPAAFDLNRLLKICQDQVDLDAPPAASAPHDATN